MKELDIITEALETHKATKVFALFSGGNDSLVSTHIATKHPNFVAAVHIDTGIGIPDTQEFVIETCKSWGVPLKIYRALENTKADGTPDPQNYEDLVLKHGFPGASSHLYMYQRLKERAVARLVREEKTGWRDRLVLISGARTSESTRRSTGYLKDGCINRQYTRVWVSPIRAFTDDDCRSYIRQHDLKTNPVKEILCMSGECLCGAFAKPGELAMIETFYPEVGKRLRDLEAKVEAAGHKRCKWDVTYGKGETKKQSEAPPLCTSCVAKYEQLELGLEFSSL